ncbi:MAG: transcriptional repressor [Anaerolineae bacterium]|nr:transcriptional repressor [Anaerolineae bacterium]
MSELTILIDRFKQQGYKMTPQRRAILHMLAGPGVHLTAEKIHEQVHKTMPDLSLATVYNTLRELVSVKVVRELELGLGKHYYEVARARHAHLICLHCNEVYDLSVNWEDLGALLSASNGFTPLSYEIVVQGYCADCSLPDTPQNN